MQQDHQIGLFRGKGPGPLVIAMGGLHGNEPAGVRAISRLMYLLEGENPVFNGSILGLRGNTRALQAGKRFLEEDLNRIWTPERASRGLESEPGSLGGESLELRELLLGIGAQVKALQPERIVFIDLHTTSAQGGIFSICADNPLSEQLALGLKVPVIRGMLTGLAGTTLQFFSSSYWGLPSVAVGFEAGFHQDPLSADRCLAALILFLRQLNPGFLLENPHEGLLQDYARHLPDIADLQYIHLVGPDDHFTMLPGFQNFQPVVKGQILAADRKGNIHCPSDGFILMPLYQSQGREGFFIVR